MPLTEEELRQIGQAAGEGVAGAQQEQKMAEAAEKEGWQDSKAMQVASFVGSLTGLSWRSSVSPKQGGEGLMAAFDPLFDGKDSSEGLKWQSKKDDEDKKGVDTVNTITNPSDPSSMLGQAANGMGMDPTDPATLISGSGGAPTPAGGGGGADPDKESASFQM